MLQISVASASSPTSSKILLLFGKYSPALHEWFVRPYHQRSAATGRYRRDHHGKLNSLRYHERKRGFQASVPVPSTSKSKSVLQIVDSFLFPSFPSFFGWENGSSSLRSTPFRAERKTNMVSWSRQTRFASFIRTCRLGENPFPNNLHTTDHFNPISHSA